MKKIFILGALLFITSIPMVSCTDDDDKDPNFMPPDIVMGGGDVESEYPEDLPVPGASVVYAPSLNANMYRPYQCQVFQCLSSHIQLENREYTYYCVYGRV